MLPDSPRIPMVLDYIDKNHGITPEDERRNYPRTPATTSRAPHPPFDAWFEFGEARPGHRWPISHAGIAVCQAPGGGP